ncbi:phage tail sheath subtilisin-like domain-containing protein [Paenibacillus agaridevorans]|uniref:phage tail sheath subtilisin-like domain-containing protein n=1 Tax=Paenibacillus agaridevorans TaxID=171404 RepID=UPI001BE3FC60|nr:phage tail sheath subtilisin-like domain-containing protein [Paenibacillus agaridevorans]
MAEYLSPGVYVEEFESGAKPLEGVSTSTAGFIGLAARGPVSGLPLLITSPADFARAFGSYLSESAFGTYRYLAYAVNQFFMNGGSRCYVMRVAPEDAKSASGGGEVLSVTAKNPGAWGNQIRLSFVPASKAKTQIYEELDGNRYRVKNASAFYPGDVVVFTDGASKQGNTVVSVHDGVIELASALSGDVTDTSLVPSKVIATSEFTLQVAYGTESETYEKASLNPEAPNYVEKLVGRSNLVDLSVVAASSADAPYALIAGSAGGESYSFALAGGSDGSASSLSPADFIGVDEGPGRRTGIQSFIDNDVVSIMAIPGVTDPNVQLSLVAHCESLGSRFAILDLPREATKVQDVLAHRDLFDSSYCALYNPWLQVFDPLDKRNIFIPPSGTIAGVYSRSDSTRGVQKAPANETLRGVVGLDVQYNNGEQDVLNPAGVNLIRAFTGQGIRVWGARTCSSNPIWKYINVRRLFIFLESSIKNGSNWVVFEPNTEQLWARVQRTIDAFLTRVWRDGALAGTSPSEAFYINIGRDTMTQDDIDSGRLICVIGVAPVKPAEFVVFRMTQKTGSE